MPCGSRAAYSVPSSMNTKQKAPRIVGQHLERGLLERCGRGTAASSAVTRSVSLDASEVSGGEVELAVVAASSSTRLARSPVLVRLPLWPSAIEPSAVERKVGCALCQTLAPVVE